MNIKNKYYRQMKFNIGILFFTALFLIGCGSSKKTVQKSKKSPGTVILEPTPKKLPSVKQAQHIKKLNTASLNKHTLKYIRKYAPIAVNEMHQHKIPASITLAQGILESGNGRSNLAVKSNNHFGIKCHKGWKGQRVYHDDDAKGECFRKYKYVETSYKDHSLFLSKRRRYAFLFELNRKDYKAWARGLKKAGYATDKKYPKKLIKIIKDYKLYAFDKIKAKDFKKFKKESKKKTTKKPKSKYYTVKKGDTLYAIAKRFRTTVKALKKLNDLKGNNLSIGQSLQIQ